MQQLPEKKRDLGIFHWAKKAKSAAFPTFTLAAIASPSGGRRLVGRQVSKRRVAAGKTRICHPTQG
jgi:hypothetical protein